MRLVSNWSVCAILLGSSIAQAGPVSLTCTLPTQNTDGTTLVDLAGIRFYEGNISGGPYALVADESVCAASFDRVPGTYYYVATAYNLANIESDNSNEATKVVPPTAPNPPSNLIVDPSNLVAYGLSQTRDIIVSYPIGTVPAGTACDATMRFNDKYVVPFDAVQWVGTARPEVVLAACGAG